MSDNPSQAAPVKMRVSVKVLLGILVVAILAIVVFLAVSFPKIRWEMTRYQATQAHDKGDYEKAIEKYKQLLEMKPADPEILYNSGVAYISNNQAGKAKEQMQKLRNVGNNEFANILKELIDKGVEKSKDRSR